MKKPVGKKSTVLIVLAIIAVAVVIIVFRIAQGRKMSGPGDVTVDFSEENPVMAEEYIDGTREDIAQYDGSEDSEQSYDSTVEMSGGTTQATSGQATTEPPVDETATEDGEEKTLPKLVTPENYSLAMVHYVCNVEGDHLYSLLFTQELKDSLGSRVSEEPYATLNGVTDVSDINLTETTVSFKAGGTKYTFSFEMDGMHISSIDFVQ